MVVVSSSWHPEPIKGTTSTHSHGFVMEWLQWHRLYKFSEDDSPKTPCGGLKAVLTLFSRPKNNPVNVDVGYFWTPNSMQYTEILTREMDEYVEYRPAKTHAFRVTLTHFGSFLALTVG